MHVCHEKWHFQSNFLGRTMKQPENLNLPISWGDLLKWNQRWVEGIQHCGGWEIQIWEKASRLIKNFRDSWLGTCRYTSKAR